MNKFKHVEPLTDKERGELEDIRKQSDSQRVRDRAHGILLSDEGYTINEISDIFRVDRDTISRWIKKWEKDGIEGLYDKLRSGRKPTLTEEEQEILRELINENPRNLKLVGEKLKEKTGKSLSAWSLRRWAKKLNLKWKRVRKSLKSKRDEEEFRKAKEEIESFEKEEKKGEIEVVYFDESGFDLTPAVPYAWQPAGVEETIEVPSANSQRINVAGFLSKENELTPFVFEGSINSEIVVSLFDAYCEQIDKPTIVILDNASMHTSQLFIERIPYWQEQGLFPYQIPTYSPELNSIEILWKKIKYEWLPFSAYESFQKLQKALENVLIDFGDKYLINFA